MIEPMARRLPRRGEVSGTGSSGAEADALRAMPPSGSSGLTWDIVVGRYQVERRRIRAAAMTAG
jgi:hypothetical protein